VLVIGWTALFASGIVSPAGTFLPGWFTSQGFNFPLNLITTVAELFIGFLVAAASNRSERNLNRTLAAIAQQEAQIRDVEDGLRLDLTANTDLTRKVHDLQTQQMTLLAGIEHANAELNLIRQAIAPGAPNPSAGADPAARAATRRRTAAGRFAPESREAAERLHNPATDV